MKQARFERTFIFSNGPTALRQSLQVVSIFGNKSPTFLPLTELENLGGAGKNVESSAALCRVLSSGGRAGGAPLQLSPME
eukprot:CAMPEP_0185569970 /NCGR_PEP_ID=MMETSP0434-20130131/2440_1 /TAXON_ID=626734 ORGANISM="Favella taraikaensis, Strain Fe Narragansett Bay" /NCGR_SAMPLE_ID=MMETSP0434 /ASSEMBLY_ACC=CAM_ASM_000379 /LENGTH=79 /DNA_ID=CAMNT_0028184951 /DNA_START=290 /DNA_END=529 /DNA_ORIENTATION=+